ncbi:hypothetical protein IMZ48_21995 [Candidatus Bathyarchaeota archaeon]|nr:hypothetical protein [Candidatus Bathyarchaeota archaeon]
MEKAEQIHNVDFSGPAIDMCREKERELLGVNGSGEFALMEWSVVDLLAADDIMQLAAHRDRTPPYDVVVDKSTATRYAAPMIAPCPLQF